MSILVFIFGLLFGSFYNVCIYRLPIGKSVVTPRSSCGACSHELNGIDMIPVFSYILFRGKCRHCDAKYSPRYAIVELLTGVLFVLVYLRFGLTIHFMTGIVLSSIVIMVTFIDIDHHIILDRFSVFIILMAIIHHFIVRDVSILNIGIGFLIGGGLLFILAIVSVMGGGDIKIMASYGLLLGFPKVLMALYLGFVLGAVLLGPWELAKFIRTKIKKLPYERSLVPFGPFLSIGVWLTYMYGEQLFEFYLSVFM